MGDSLGDLHMAEGIPNPNVILKIGFLNKNNEKDLAKYKVGWVLHDNLVSGHALGQGQNKLCS
jgi:hypothetical protein